MSDIDQWHVRETNVDEATIWPKDDKNKAIEDYNDFKNSWDADLEVVGPEGRVVKSTTEDSPTNVPQEPEIVEESEPIDGTKEPDTEQTEEPDSERMAEGYRKQEERYDDGIDALAKNPIEWLNSKNSEYVNVIKGTDAISKRGFRYIQSQFGISTQSKIVEVLDDPLGVIVWAKAELPNGRHAEAHGEGYQFESGLDDNEFARYADTRAKSRALADLTASGALATEEMTGHEE